MSPIRQYRAFQKNEFIVVGGDCSQGGKDYNALQFLSKTRLDVPMVYECRGVAAQMTPDLHKLLEEIFDRTGVKPVVALERNNGGASEMERLRVLNRSGKYILFKMPKLGLDISSEDKETDRWGYDTNTATRPMLLGDLKNAIDAKTIGIYDERTVSQFFSFVINERGKPEAERGMHDDLVMSLAIAWQLYQICKPQSIEVFQPGPVFKPSDSVIGV